MLKRIVGLVAVLLLGLQLAGCGGGATTGRVKVYKTSGKITFVGSPLIGALVTFAPQEKQPAAVGRTNDLGEFTLTTYGGGDGAAAGEYKVMVMLTDAGSEQAPEAAHSADPTAVLPGSSHAGSSAKKSSGSLLPPKFGDFTQTPLTAKVDPNGENKFTFELK